MSQPILGRICHRSSDNDEITCRTDIRQGEAIPQSAIEEFASYLARRMQNRKTTTTS